MTGPAQVGDLVMVLAGDERHVPTGVIGRVTELDTDWPHTGPDGQITPCARVHRPGGPVALGRLPGVWVDQASLATLRDVTPLTWTDQAGQTVHGALPHGLRGPLRVQVRAADIPDGWDVQNAEPHPAGVTFTVPVTGPQDLLELAVALTPLPRTVIPTLRGLPFGPDLPRPTVAWSPDLPLTGWGALATRVLSGAGCAHLPLRSDFSADDLTRLEAIVQAHRYAAGLTVPERIMRLAAWFKATLDCPDVRAPNLRASLGLD